MTSSTTVTRVQSEDRALVERLLWLYNAQLLDNTAAEACVISWLDHYWMHTGYDPFVIWHNAHPVGFALVSEQCLLSTARGGHSCSLLFVLRYYRRQGIGQQAAWALFTMFPGSWEVTAKGANGLGLAFWRAVVDRYTSGHYQERWLNTPEWRGNIQSFGTTSPQQTKLIQHEVIQQHAPSS